MGEKIKKYIKEIDEMLAKDEEGRDWENERKKHLVQIGFFAHERLIHLIVTVLFAVVTIMVFLYLLTEFSIAVGILLLLLLVLLIPYIKHYYLLENSVQYMYEQYDELVKRSER